jgi:alkylhydroperoxidase/carboxymuconolactone decarboxylase family protein YurZ
MKKKENWKRRAMEATERVERLTGEVLWRNKLLEEKKTKIAQLQADLCQQEDTAIRQYGEISSGTRIIDRQREVLILYQKAAQIAGRAVNAFLAVALSKTTRHDLWGARCVVLGETWQHAVLHMQALDKALAAIAVDIATGTEAR